MIFKPSLPKVLYNIGIGILGFTMLSLILNIFLNKIIIYILISSFFLLYLYFYLYRDFISLQINKHEVLIKRYGTTIHSFNIKSSEFIFPEKPIKRKVSIQSLTVYDKDKEFIFDIELISASDYQIIKSKLS